MDFMKTTKKKPSEQAMALALYVSWCNTQDEADLWEELPDREQERAPGGAATQGLWRGRAWHYFFLARAIVSNNG